MLLGRYETTAATLAWAICLLAQHPDAQERLREELSTELGGRAPVTEDLARPPFTKVVIDETMRLAPPVWLVARNAARSEAPAAAHHRRKLGRRSLRFLYQRS